MCVRARWRPSDLKVVEKQYSARNLAAYLGRCPAPVGAGGGDRAAEEDRGGAGFGDRWAQGDQPKQVVTPAPVSALRISTGPGHAARASVVVPGLTVVVDRRAGIAEAPTETAALRERYPVHRCAVPGLRWIRLAIFTHPSAWIRSCTSTVVKKGGHRGATTRRLSLQSG